jgi:sulfur-carrier protein
VLVQILYFAWVREAIGLGEEWVDTPPDVLTLNDLALWLAKRGGGYGEAFADLSRLRCAIDQTMAHFEALIAGAQEIAFFPPVTGG